MGIWRREEQSPGNKVTNFSCLLALQVPGNPCKLGEMGALFALSGSTEQRPLNDHKTSALRLGA